MLLRLICLIRRHHEYRIRDASGRAFLECNRCGHCSPGWEHGVRPRPTGTPAFRVELGDASDLELARHLDLPPRQDVRPAPAADFRLLLDH